jgi:phosphomannomutase
MNASLSHIVNKLPRFFMVKDKMTLSKEKLEASISKLAKLMSADTVSELDGVRLDWKDRWLLLRASNTEPIVRIIAESPSEAQTLDLIKKAKQIIEA